MRISDWSSDVCSSDLPAEAALRKEIATLLEKGVSEEEVAAAKKRLVAGAVYARDNLSTAPRVIGAALTTGGSLEQVESWPERIETEIGRDTSELQSLMRTSYAVFCLKKKKQEYSSK